MLSPYRQALVTNLLSRCHQVFAANPGDIPSLSNTVQTYLDPINQHKYVDMYFAKYVGAWRRIRRLLGFPSDSPLVLSIGAGPCLCLMGWFWDKSPEPHQSVAGLDLLAWSGIHLLPEFAALRDEIFRGARSFSYESPWFFPAILPPQGIMPQLGGASSIDPSAIPDGTTVLLPMVLNHMIGGVQPLVRPEPVFTWLREVSLRARRIVVVDMPESKTAGFWGTFWSGLGYFGQSTARTFEFNLEAQEFSPAYPDNEGPRRTGLKYPSARFCELSGAMFDRHTGQWTYF